MREELAERILATNGLTNPLKMGDSFGWTTFYELADHSTLGLEVRPKQLKGNGPWTDGLVRAAFIQSNGINIVSISLTNKP
jgi:hypothetical protein